MTFRDFFLHPVRPKDFAVVMDSILWKVLILLRNTLQEEDLNFTDIMGNIFLKYKYFTK